VISAVPPAERLIIGRRSNQRATGLAPPAYLTPWPPLLPYSVFNPSGSSLGHGACQMCLNWPLTQKSKCHDNSLCDKSLAVRNRTPRLLVMGLQDWIWTAITEGRANATVTSTSSNTCTGVTFWTVRQLPDGGYGVWHASG
jgi:hypothetical protein